MKKLLSLIALLLVITCLFAACKKDKTPVTNDDGFVEEPVDEEALAPNVFDNMEDFVNFFEIESAESMGVEYEQIFTMVKESGVVLKPLLAGEDVTLQEEHARIIVNPARSKDSYSNITYNYTNGVYNVSIVVYYLDDSGKNLASIAGLHAMYNGNEDVVERSMYGDYTIVTNLPDLSTYAERFVFENYFVVVTGAHIANAEPKSVIETEVLDILSFEFKRITDNSEE